MSASSNDAGVSSHSRQPPPPRLTASPTYQNNPAVHHHSSTAAPLLASGLPDDTMLNGGGDDSVFLPSSPPQSFSALLPPPPPVAELSSGLFSKLKVKDFLLLNQSIKSINLDNHCKHVFVLLSLSSSLFGWSSSSVDPIIFLHAAFRIHRIRIFSADQGPFQKLGWI